MPKNIVKRNSLSEQAAQFLKDSILSLEVEPEARLIVDDLAEKYHISRTPIREALKDLASQGLVSYNGIVYRVTKLTKVEIIELYSVREVLEVLAASQAAVKISPSELKKIVQLNNSYDLHCTQKQLIDLDIEFHQLIQNASHNTHLQAMLRIISEQILLVRRWLFKDQSNKSIEEDTIKEHSSLVESIAQHDSAMAAKHMQHHITQSQNRLMAIVKKDNRFF